MTAYEIASAVTPANSTGRGRITAARRTVTIINASSTGIIGSRNRRYHQSSNTVYERYVATTSITAAEHTSANRRPLERITGAASEHAMKTDCVSTNQRT